MVALATLGVGDAAGGAHERGVAGQRAHAQLGLGQVAGGVPGTASEDHDQHEDREPDDQREDRRLDPPTGRAGRGRPGQEVGVRHAARLDAGVVTARPDPFARGPVR